MKKGSHHTKEAIEKIRQKALEQFKDGVSEETRRRLSENNPKFWLGKKIPREVVKKRTETRKRNGFWRNREETARKISLANKGRKMSKEWKEKMSKSKMGEKNPMWKGDNVGYGKLHEWLRNHKPKPKLCEDCNKKIPEEIANISGIYIRDVKDYKWLCKSCHAKRDKIFLNFHKKGKKEKKARRSL